MSTVELKGLKGLRGLNSLITEPAIPLEQIEKLSIDSLTPGKYQPRKQMDMTALHELAASIKAQGIIQPLVARKIDHNKYEIIAGERRWRAAQIAGLTSVPTIIRDISDNVALAFALIENIQRENLNPIEEAVAFTSFREEFSMTHEEIAQYVGRSRTSITNTLRLLLLNERVRALLEEGKLEMGHARALLTLNPLEQLEVALKIIEKQLNVREAERLATVVKKKTSGRGDDAPLPFQAQCEYWAQKLSKQFATPVSIKLDSKGRGTVTLSVDSLAKIEWLIQHIKL